MAVEIRRVGPEALENWGQVPISFEVNSVLEIEERESGLGGLALVERPFPEPYVENYDAEKDNRPKGWLRFSVEHWGFLQAFVAGKIAGCAAVACKSPSANSLEDRDDLAALWDIRVDPEHRGEGIGTALFKRAIEHARAEGCKLLRIETQNINVAACRFYSKQGCWLREVRRGAYGPGKLEHEVMLIWALDL
jgi:ribosomal protein S18 acetylase RimI-like enzyme